MNTIRTIIVAAALATLSGYAQAETVKPLQGVSFHTEDKDAIAYYLADKGSCKVIVTLTDKAAYAPTRFEEAIEARKSVLREIGDGKALELACQPDAQAMAINLLPVIAQH